MTSTLEGTVQAGFEAVAETFEASLAQQPVGGAALCVLVDGQTAVNIWGGEADTRSRSRWKADTSSVIFSCTKGLVSILAARLVQEGKLDYWSPVTEYWPEFGAAGKSETLVRDLIAHRAGLPAFIDDLIPADILDWDNMISRLAAEQPLWEPGDHHGYHAITHGWLVGELIRRITGMTVGEYFQDLIATPLGVDAWIGVPPARADTVAHTVAGPSMIEQFRQRATASEADSIDWALRALTLGQALPATLVGDGTGFNHPLVRSAEIPGAGGIATARALATIWSATVTETSGMRLLRPEIMTAASRPQSEGSDYFGSPGPAARWGMGFQLPSLAREYLTGASFGHDGAGGQVAFADPLHKVGFAFLTNFMESGDDPRGTRIVDALRRVVCG